ncbi:hypothetical protein AB0H83_23255 [Dactylosporangium sp. NPDC050688]|uniref:hypothetical protein n=1 Tax=Dactylosporangium sp. NPDC050688 TaxID=3157217 RepID=UPI0033C4732A
MHVTLASTGTLAYFTDAVAAVTVDRSGQRGPKAIPFWAIAFQPFVIMLCEGASAPTEAARIDQWLTYADNAIYNKADRKTSYPIARRGNLWIEFLHSGAEKLQHEDESNTHTI